MLSKLPISMLFCFTEECSSTATSPQNVTLERPIHLNSPNFPYHYPPNLQCVWTLRSTEGRSFAIRFLSFNTHQQNSDYLTIIAGSDYMDTVVGTDSGAHEPAQASSVQLSFWISPGVVAMVEGSSMSLTFQSDALGSSTGFELQIERSIEGGTKLIKYSFELFFSIISRFG